MTVRIKILRALQSGEKTNSQLQDICGTDSADIARTCWNLKNEGQIVRANAGGRGAKAVYALSATAGGVAVRRRPVDVEHVAMELVLDGCSAAEIAAELSISTGWAENLIAKINAGAPVLSSDERMIAHQTGLLIAAIRRHHPERCGA